MCDVRNNPVLTSEAVNLEDGLHKELVYQDSAAVKDDQLPEITLIQSNSTNETRDMFDTISAQPTQIKTELENALNTNNSADYFMPPPLALPPNVDLPELSKDTDTVQMMGKNGVIMSNNCTSKTNQSRTVAKLPLKPKIKEPALEYLEPPWGGSGSSGYLLEVLKEGSIIGSFQLDSRSFHVFGRLQTCDVTLEHPSLSRHHAVVQFAAKPDVTHPAGWYIYDLGSTHGTSVNKVKIRPRCFHRLRVGHVLKFGLSTRLYVLQGPYDDKEDEVPIPKKVKVDTECDWGMAMEPVEDMQAIIDKPQNEDLYIEDPKKALKGVFDREGFDLPEYTCEEDGFNWKCRVELPMLLDDVGAPMVAVASISGKKKDAVLACALEACRLLDMHGELRKSTHQRHSNKGRDWQANDFYDSDEDEFLDRTGQIEKKRQERKKKMGLLTQETKTYSGLVEELAVVEKELQEIEEKLQKSQSLSAFMSKKESAMDALDEYMMHVKDGSALDSQTRRKLKSRQFELKQLQSRLSRLANIAKPVSLPTAPAAKTTAMIGKRITVPVKKPQKVKTAAPTPAVESDETEDDDEDSAAPIDTIKSVKEIQPQHKKDNDRQDGQSMSAIEQKVEMTGRTVGTDVKECGVTTPDQEDIECTDTAVKEPVCQINNDSVGTSDSTAPCSIEKQEEFVSEKDKKSQRNERKRKHQMATKAYLPPENSRKPLLVNDPTYETWLPPSGQSGDGRTSLNEKLGY